MDCSVLSKLLIEWFSEPAHYSVIHFAIEHGISKEELFRKASESAELQKALDYGFSVQEYKLAEGALNGAVEKMTALKMLETYNGWKGEVNILQKNEYKQYMNDAMKRAGEVMKHAGDVMGRVERGTGGDGLIYTGHSDDDVDLSKAGDNWLGIDIGDDV